MTRDTFIVRRVVDAGMSVLLTLMQLAIEGVQEAHVEYSGNSCPGNPGHVFVDARIMWDGKPMDGFECVNCGEVRPLLYTWDNPRSKS